jgi:hypothetical protein
MAVRAIRPSNTAAIDEIRQRCEAARVSSRSVKSGNKDTAFSRMNRRHQLLDDLRRLGLDSWVKQGKQKEFDFLTQNVTTPLGSLPEA